MEENIKKPFNKSEKWLAAQARLAQERITNPEKFRPKNIRRGPIQQKKIVPQISRTEFNDATISRVQRMMNMAFSKLEQQLENSKENGNPVATSLVLKNLNDISNSTQGSGALSKAKETKDLMRLDGKQLDREALIAMNQSATITNLADVQQFIDRKEQNSK